MSLRRNDQGQIIILAGFILAIGIIFFSVILHSAAFAGHQTIAQETADVNYDFKCLKDVYGDMLKRASSESGDANPFNAPNYPEYERHIIKIYSYEGYALTFADHTYANQKATTQITLSDGETIYIETVTYELG